MTNTRERSQFGSLTIETRRNGPDVWVYRWSERTTLGVVRRKVLLGSKKALPTKTGALKAVQELRINLSYSRPCSSTVQDAVARYRATQLVAGCGKSQRTIEVYNHQLSKVILPFWGSFLLSAVKPVALESWFGAMTQAAGTKAKTRCVFSCVFQHAMRHEMVSSNPVRLVRQGSTPQREYEALSPVELAALLAELRGVFRTIVYTAALTGLRRGELFGLKWEDLDLQNRQLTVRRSWVDGIEGPPKTLASRRPIPLADELVRELDRWRAATPFPLNENWVFASPATLGKPYWPDAVLKRHVLPAAERAGLQKDIAWHTFRRTTATLLLSSGASISTAQALLRHASPSMTLGVYSRALTADKRLGQAGIAVLLEQAGALVGPNAPLN